MELIHYNLTEIQYSLTEVDQFFIMTLTLPISQPIRFSPKRTPDLKLGSITVQRYNYLLVTSLMFPCFLMFSIVFPKTALFIKLKKSFSKLLVALVLSCVLKSM